MEMQSKNKTGDNSIAGAVIAAICIIIYLLALVQSAVRLYLSMDKSKNTAEQEFSRLINIAMSAGAQGFMDDHFIGTMNNALRASKNIEAVIISGPEGEYAFEKHQGRAITWVNNSPRFLNKLSFSNQSHYEPLPLPDLRNVNISAKSMAFDFVEFTSILKETLLIILIGFAISFFTMLMQILLGKQHGKYEPVYVSSFEHHEREPVPAEHETMGTAESGPKGLYSSRSNIGWEEYLKDRLDSELHRCSSTEKDLALILMEFTGITNDAMFRQAAEEAVSFFKSRDLLFEYGRQGISAILTGSDLETCLSRAKKFYQRITEKFPHSGNSVGLCIGLSSRSGRLLNGDRLMKEAKEALNKARTDSKTSIIAFKSDLEKYRTFIATQDSRHQ